MSNDRSTESPRPRGRPRKPPREEWKNTHSDAKHGIGFREKRFQGVAKEVKRLVSYQVDVVCAPWYKRTADGWAAQTHTFEKARRIGGSEAMAIRGLSFALGREMKADGTWIQREPMDVYVTSKDFPGAKDVIRKIAENCLEMGEHDAEIKQAQIHSTKIYIPSTGKEIVALAPTPTAIRGKTGAWLADEFSFVKNQEELWGAGKIIGNRTLGDPHGFPSLIVCTPWEEGSMAWRIFRDDSFSFRDNRFSVDIYQAKAAGFPIDIDAAFSDLGIPELIETEYKCKWSKGGGQFFSTTKLRDCLEEELPLNWQLAPCFYGIDVGHGVGRDFTACVQWRMIDDEYWITGIRAFNNLEMEEQIEAIAPWIRRYPGEIRVDRGMGGIPFMTTLAKRLGKSGNGRSRIVGAGMTGNDQEKYAHRMRRILDSHQLKIYSGIEAGGDESGARVLCLELARMKAKLAAGGRLILETPRDPLKGHCDRAWAGMIGLASVAGAGITSGGVNGMGTGWMPGVCTAEFDHTGIG